VPAAPAVRAAPGIAAPPRRLRAVPDLDAEATGSEDSPRAFPWS